jgi:hypothetical protein
MGISPSTKVITRRGKNNTRVTQSGTRKLITGLKAVSPDDFSCPHYLISKYAKHMIDWYRNVKDEDTMAHWTVSLTG